ncbi:hypothetical protein FGG08_000481 [Glutinoglossum americanum]|uniref:Protein kinase domain-containing protein n=1 Tax=Glutinoglossum americanum TaxID=1670608 RepID=A0A9P8ID66_9PEZI|nr:hypothetical protein FGG08_000481 [Glutinoglossum americanum]
MNPFGVTLGAITEICRITIFIRDIIADGRAYDPDRQGIRDKLEHELLFMESFRELFFDNDGALMRYDRLPTNLRRDVDVTLNALKKTLAEYGMLAARHGFLDLENDGQAVKTATNDEALISLRERIKSKLIDLKKKNIDWALFGKGEMLKTLSEYSEWAERLRQTMSLMLLTLTAFGDTTLRDFADSKRAMDMGLQEVAQRQILAHSGPPEDFKALDGLIVEVSETPNTSSIRLARYEDEWGAAREVVVEYRTYDSALAYATEVNSPDLAEMKTPTRNLAWLLCSASFTQGPDGDVTAISNRPGISTLQCLGYLDQPEHYQTIFLYQLPRLRNLGIGSSIITLHDLINGGTVGAQAPRPTSKPSLGNRFSLAHTLASAVLNIHSSGWVHKNIWSRGVVVFPSSTSTPGSESEQHLVPYLTGWGLARPVLGSTDLATNTEAEPNFYRHPSRQGQPKSSFTAEHDIYALGVVLLEIALWRTIGSVFKKQIDKATVEGRLPPPEMVRKALLDRARADVPREMGEGYAKAVERCLNGDFGVDKDGDERTGLPVAVREMVVEVIARGMKL